MRGETGLPQDPPRRRGRFPQAIHRAILVPIALAVLAGGAFWSGMFERLAYLPTRDTPPAPPGIEDVWFEASDGTRLHGWFLPARAAGPAGSSRGSVLAVHGNAGNVSTHAGFIEFLPHHGFDVLIFDYRGYGRSDRGRLRRPYLLSDTQAALDALLERPDVDARRVALYAQSLGTSFGTHTMLARRELRAAVLVSPFSTWPAMAASVFGGSRPGPVARLLGRLTLRSGLDPLDAIRRIDDRPLLVVHGTADRVVPFSHAERIRDAAGANLTLRAVPGRGHNDLPYGEPGLEREIAEFLAASLDEAESGGR